jgi:hypothetical protein
VTLEERIADLERRVAELEAREAPTRPDAPLPKRISSGAMPAVRTGGLAERVEEILERGKDPR